MIVFLQIVCFIFRFHFAERACATVAAAVELVAPTVSCVSIFDTGMQDCQIHSGHEERGCGKVFSFGPEDVE